MQDFRKLHVWDRAHRLAMSMTHIVRRRFPRRDFAKLRDQLTRACESVPENIAEGCGAATRKEFARFLDIGIKSANETEYELLLAHDYGIIPHPEWRALTTQIIEIRMMMCGLRRRVREADQQEARRKRRTNAQKRRRKPRTDY